MSVADRIERLLYNYYFLNGELPLSIQVPMDMKKELEKQLDELLTAGVATEYKAEDTEFGRYRGIKVYVERPKELKITF